jgi:hypothetical protein
VSARYRSLRLRALAKVIEAHRLVEELIELPEHIDGSPPGEALHLLDGAIVMLSPDDEDTTSDGRPFDPLRLAVSDGRHV